MTMKRVPRGAERTVKARELDKVPGGQVEVFVPLRGDAKSKRKTEKAFRATLREITGRRPDWAATTAVKRGFYRTEYAGAAWRQMTGRVAKNISVALRIFPGATMRMTLPPSSGDLILNVILDA